MSRSVFMAGGAAIAVVASALSAWFLCRLSTTLRVSTQPEDRVAQATTWVLRQSRVVQGAILVFGVWFGVHLTLLGQWRTMWILAVIAVLGFAGYPLSNLQGRWLVRALFRVDLSSENTETEDARGS